MPGPRGPRIESCHSSRTVTVSPLAREVARQSSPKGATSGSEQRTQVVASESIDQPRCEAVYIQNRLSSLVAVHPPQLHAVSDRCIIRRFLYLLKHSVSFPVRGTSFRSRCTVNRMKYKESPEDEMAYQPVLHQSSQSRRYPNRRLDQHGQRPCGDAEGYYRS